MLSAGSLALAATTAMLLQWAPAAPASTGKAPNIILLGIDSLRPDLVTAEDTPHVKSFLDSSIRMTDAVTPLARTFPSWVSILTGRHPHTTGAVMNLLPRELIHEGSTLPALLREHGYHTVYAIDETRFSNVDGSYGFDAAITPPIGGSDFVLAWFSDTPLSNLVMNTRLGALMFPFQHANRAAFVTYNPDSFVGQVAGALDAREPLFLALHLTLPHWPFEWSDSALPTAMEAPDFQAGVRWKYINTIRRADEQFGDLMQVLERKGLLANAIVVALSDHGEAFGPEDGFVLDALPGEDSHAVAAQEKGHGTSVFSPRQYHTVLGFRAYGNAAALLPPPHVVDEPVSLLDLAPTLLELTGTATPPDLDGASLMPLFRGDPGASRNFGSRIRFTESEYNPGGFDTSNMTESALAHAAMVYQVDPRTDRLRVRPELIGILMGTRQYAALLGDSIAGAVPQPTGGNPYRFVYRPGAAGNAREQAQLKAALEQRFGIQFAGDTLELKPGP
jgi:arylsulfatase A-like enzyme